MLPDPTILQALPARCALNAGHRRGLQPLPDERRVSPQPAGELQHRDLGFVHGVAERFPEPAHLGRLTQSPHGHNPVTNDRIGHP